MVLFSLMQITLCSPMKIMVCLLIYADDLLISDDNIASIIKFKKYLSLYFHMKDLGLLKYF